MLFFLPHRAMSQLRLDPLFTDHMVIQQGQIIRIRGYGMPGSRIEGSMAHDQSNTTVKSDSSWILEFQKLKGSTAKLSIIISCQNQRIELSDILLGDVWLCLGQSNMEWPMHKEMHYKEEIPSSVQPLLRFFNPNYAGKGIYDAPYSDSVTTRLYSNRFFLGSWQVSDSISFRAMSAVAYYFGKEILSIQEIPIGLINLSIGGAPLETFIDKNVLKKDIRFASKIKGDWLNNGSLPVWIRERGKQNIGQPNSSYSNDVGQPHPYSPGYIFDHGIISCTRMPIKGIIFYQGESNAQEVDRVNEYSELFKLMVLDYRRQWNLPNLPFYFVQLSSIDTLTYKSQWWPQFRNEQRKSLKGLNHLGMAVSSDVGALHDVHPANKKIIGHRLAIWALNKTYKKKMVPSGPLVRRASYRHGSVVITFKFGGAHLSTSDQSSVRGFSLNGQEDSPAIIHRHTVQIKTTLKPEYIYYAWQPFSNANLTNDKGLPASTFKIKVK